MKLSEKYTLERGPSVSDRHSGAGSAAHRPDAPRPAAGLNTGAFISGYEGSPLGGYDMALARAGKLLTEHNIHFRPGVNEDLAATAVMGSQIYEVIGTEQSGRRGRHLVRQRAGRRPLRRHPPARQPGAARERTAPRCVLCGDDPISKSSTIPHQSDFSLFNLGIPFLYPGNTQEIIDYGLLAIALSRFSGAWVGMKMVTDVCDGGGTVEADPDRPAIRFPEGYREIHRSTAGSASLAGARKRSEHPASGSRAAVRALESVEPAQRRGGARWHPQHRANLTTT